MDRLSLLSMELLLAVVGFVLPADLTNFARVSRRIYDAVHPGLNMHRCMIEIHGRQPLRCNVRTTPKEMMKILKDPWVGQYVQALEIFDEDGALQEAVKNWNLSDKEHTLLMDAVSGNKWISRCLRDEEGLKTAFETYGALCPELFMLLASYLPNLTRLTCDGDIGWPLGVSHPKFAYLRKLKYLDIHQLCNGDDDTDAFCHLKDFTRKNPGCEVTLRLQREDVAPNDVLLPGTYDLNACNIDIVYYQDDQETSACANETLRHIQNVRAFTFSSELHDQVLVEGGNHRKRCQNSKVAEVCNSLVKSSHDTLLELTLCTSNPTPAFDSLRHLSRLRSLEIWVTHVSPLGNNIPKYLCGNLPPSLQSLKVNFKENWVSRYDVPARMYYYTAFAHFALINKFRQQANLRHIEFRTKHEQPPAMFVELLKQRSADSDQATTMKLTWRNRCE